MTQQPAASATAVPPAPLPSSFSSSSSSTSSTSSSMDGSSSSPLRAQIDAAMARLLSVSSKFKDLTGQDRTVSTREETIAMMHHYMDRLAMTARVRQLSVIHVAGTKGKGSTCAMTERILRAAGLKTGLFTSPHLISPCERVRINGKPVAARVFLDHFDRVWTGLAQTATQSGEYPPMAWFFRFLTLLALHIFIEEQVDVVVLEVGIGGRLDATNVIQHPVVCGVSTLDLDHTRVLGATLDKIAYAKAGIFKKGVPAFTTAQEPLAMDTLVACAAETQNPLFHAPVLDPVYTLGMRGDYQRINAGLAVALAGTWLQRHRGQPFSTEFLSQPLEDVVRIGLEKAFWPARAHVLADPAHHTTFYIDGAHTMKSLEVCAAWFTQMMTTPGATSKRALVFTIHYERNVASIIAPLLSLPFDRVYFCPTQAARPSLAKMNTFSEALADAQLGHVVAKYSADELATLDAVPEGKLQWQTTLSQLWLALTTHVAGVATDAAAIHVLPSVADCIHDLRAQELQHGEQWSVLATGSLYLAGETLEFMNWRE